MAPETRAAGGVPAPSRIYNSSPALQQVQFPSRRKKVRTYGRQTPVSLRQQTLTQIDFVSSFSEEDMVTLTDSEAEQGDKENRLPKERARGRGQLDKEPVSAARPTGKRPSTSLSRGGGSKRRRTLGDDDETDTDGAQKARASRRKTVGDAPISSNYHTQTLTQFLGHRSCIADSDDDDDDLDVGSGADKDDGFQDWLGEPGLSPSVRRSQSIARASPSHGSPSAARSKHGKPAPSHDQSREESVIPQTPVKRITSIRFAVPSGGLRSPCIERYGPPDVPHSPLDSFSPTRSRQAELEGAPLRLEATPPRPALAIQDSLVTESLTSPVGFQARQDAADDASSTPTEAAQKRDEGVGCGEQAGPGAKQAGSASPRKRKTAPNKAGNGLFEIPDSDDEEEDFEEEQCVRGGDGRHDTQYYAAGPETQLVMKELVSSEEELRGRPSLAAAQTWSVPSSRPRPQPQGAAGSTPTTHGVARSPARPLKPVGRRVRHGSSSQPHMESQRVPLSILQSLPAHTARSDILLSVSSLSSSLAALVAGRAEHVDAPFKIPAQVVRFWLLDDDDNYGHTPLLRYMASVDMPPEVAPGAVVAAWRYRVVQVYELNNPVSEADMVDEGWFHGRVGRYVYLPPAVTGQLLWNLRHALFTDGTPRREEQDCGLARLDVGEQQRQQPPSRPATPTDNVTLSQQVAAQIRHDMARVPATPDHHPSPAPPTEPPSSSTGLAFLDHGTSLVTLPASSSSLPASQLLSKSQMLPDSLLRDDRPPPPPPLEIWDSDDDEAPF